MNISGLEKLTLTDYPGHIACIVFTQGCNFRCPFCQNSTLLGFEEGLLSVNEVMEYIEKRKGVLEGVVISGGEPTIQKGLKQFITRIKELGLKVKLDTNGFKYEVLEDLVNNGLVDYVAMDVKNTFDSYDEVSGVKVEVKNILKSIEILKENKVDYELRTTIVKEFHDIDKILKLCEMFKSSKYFLQNYEDSENVLKGGLHGFSDKELENISRKISKYSNVKIRGK